MVRRKKVYICDHCGEVDLETIWGNGSDLYKGPPYGWTKLGNEDLCPICSETYRRFKAEVVDEEVKVHRRINENGICLYYSDGVLKDKENK